MWARPAAPRTVSSILRRCVHVKPYWERPHKGQKVAVFGAGAFGTAMAALSSRNGCDVSILARQESVAEHINRHGTNPVKQSEFVLKREVSGLQTRSSLVSPPFCLLAPFEWHGKPGLRSVRRVWWLRCTKGN